MTPGNWPRAIWIASTEFTAMREKLRKSPKVVDAGTATLLETIDKLRIQSSPESDPNVIAPQRLVFREMASSALRTVEELEGHIAWRTPESSCPSRRIFRVV